LFLLLCSNYEICHGMKHYQNFDILNRLSLLLRRYRQKFIYRSGFTAGFTSSLYMHTKGLWSDSLSTSLCTFKHYHTCKGCKQHRTELTHANFCRLRHFTRPWQLDIFVHVVTKIEGGQSGGGGSSSSAQQQAARKVTMMCMTIATTFTVTVTPYQLVLMVMSYGNLNHALLVVDATKTLTFVNSCVNPVVYALLWRPFRSSLIQVRLCYP